LKKPGAYVLRVTPVVPDLVSVLDWEPKDVTVDVTAER
jgi:hypothetical protein